MDGGTVTAPNFGILQPRPASGMSRIKGVAPDVEVDMDPKAVHDGHDPQLERAVAIAMEQMEKNPVPAPHRPPFPNYQNPNARPSRETTAAGSSNNQQ